MSPASFASPEDVEAGLLRSHCQRRRRPAHAALGRTKKYALRAPDRRSPDRLAPIRESWRGIFTTARSRAGQTHCPLAEFGARHSSPDRILFVGDDPGRTALCTSPTFTRAARTAGAWSATRLGRRRRPHQAMATPPPPHLALTTAYRAPAWLPGGHAQTIWPLLIKPRPLPLRRERWDNAGRRLHRRRPSRRPADSPLLVLFHGLEGSSRSHYALSTAHACKKAPAGAWRCRTFAAARAK
jgi:hypothetical protein